MWQLGCVPKTELLRTTIGGYYDFETMIVTYGDGILGDRNSREFISLWQTFMHERCHYLQHIGTTTGAFLAILQFDRLNSARQWLKTLPLSVRRRLAQDRKRSGGRAIIAIDRKESNKSRFRLSMPPPGEIEADGVDALRQILFDNWWSWQALFDGPSVAKVEHYRPPEEMFALALRDAFNVSHGLFATPEKILDTVKVHAHGLLNPKIDGIPFGTISLLEGAAVVNELLFLFRAKAPIDQIKERYASLLSSSYLVALRAFLRRGGVDDQQLPPVRQLFFFLILCDVALNPPLPPVVTTPRMAYQWEELNPAHRFLHSLDSLFVFELHSPINPTDLESHDFVSRAVANVCNACEFPVITEYDFPISGIPAVFKPSDLSHDLFTQRPAFSKTAVANIFMKMNTYDYLQCMHRIAWAERKKNLPAIILPGYIAGRYAGFERTKSPAFIIPSGYCEPGLLYPPLIFDKRTGELTSNDLFVDKNHATALYLSLFKDHLLNEMLFRTEIPDRKYWSSTDADEAFGFTRGLTDLLGESPW